MSPRIVLTWQEWKDNYKPKIKVYGKKRKIRTYTLNTFSSATMKYEYADDSNKVRVLNKLENMVSTKRPSIYSTAFTGRKRICFIQPIPRLTASKTEYNYLDMISKTTDAVGNQTKFSYDEYGDNSKTENADNSTRLIANTYQTDLSYGFGTVYGMVNKKDLYGRTWSRGRKVL